MAAHSQKRWIAPEMLDIARKLKGKNQMRVLGGRNVASLIAAVTGLATASGLAAVSYTHLRAHET